jgi:hypothetical protein
MAANKTKQTRVSPAAYLKTLSAAQRKDAEALVAMMRAITGEAPKMWGASIVGFGTCHFVYESGREGDICLVGFAARNPNLVLYLGEALQDSTLTSRLGPHTRGKGCLYIKGLEHIDLDALRALITKTVELARRRCRT